MNSLIEIWITFIYANAKKLTTLQQDDNNKSIFLTLVILPKTTRQSLIYIPI